MKVKRIVVSLLMLVPLLWSAAAEYDWIHNRDANITHVKAMRQEQAVSLLLHDGYFCEVQRSSKDDTSERGAAIAKMMDFKGAVIFCRKEIRNAIYGSNIYAVLLLNDNQVVQDVRIHRMTSFAGR